jgi:hypothetical protein
MSSHVGQLHFKETDDSLMDVYTRSAHCESGINQEQNDVPFMIHTRAVSPTSRSTVTISTVSRINAPGVSNLNSNVNKSKMLDKALKNKELTN